MSATYPKPDKHLPLQEVFPDVWLASSQVAMNTPIPLFKAKFSRNMVALWQGDHWVLINPVRLSEQAEADMLKRGPIRHALRLGVFHGRDDAWYVDQHGAKFWAVPGQQDFAQPSIDHDISEGGALPVPGAQVRIFHAASRPECVLLLPEHKLLLTCDSVQHYTDDRLITLLTRPMMQRMGFFKPCVIGPMWLRMVTPKGSSLKADFERILQLEFEHLIGGHGTPCMGTAKQELTQRVAEEFGGTG